MRAPLDWIQEFVEARARPERLAHALTMSGLEVESMERAGRTAVFEIGVTPNRADCLSIIGLAREVAAVTGARLCVDEAKPPRGEGRMDRLARVSVRSRSRCPRYAARVIRGVRTGPSPQRVSARLAACGIRSVNNVVDATNYVMLETGQPLHAFDLARIAGARIVVRRAGADRRFTTLDGVERTLAPSDLMICDAEGPVAIAGVMGGENSEVGEGTTDLLLESAFFEPAGVRATSRRLGLSTESSRRFERGVDPNGALGALHSVAALIVETAGGTPSSDWVDLYPERIGPRRIALDAGEANRILGTSLSAAAMASLLKRLGLGAEVRGRGRVSVSVPTHRPDLTRPVDLVEEVARLHGYGSIEETMPAMSMAPIARPRFMREERIVREAMIGAGLSEAVVYGFASAEALAAFSQGGPEPIRIENPLSSEQSAMVTTLLPGLVEAARENLMRQRGDVRLFALQRVFLRGAKAPGSADEPRRVAGVLTGARWPGSWERSGEGADFYDAKLFVETAAAALGLSGELVFQRGEPPAFLHPGRFAHVLMDGSRAGFVGQMHPDLARRLDVAQDLYAFELDFELMAGLSHARVERFREFSRFPFVTRDVAVVLDEAVPLCEVERAISASGVEILDGVRVFDLFRGGPLPSGKKSMALTLRFSRPDRTLTDGEVQKAHARIVEELSAKLGAVLR
ncbi:MAG: phenylalanine--tRNA ligase subunit beta [Proteobacteria bacterium]|nr:phenylalanine--tRNA ligase subunit beta [Pseudomonadota bacterium]